MEMLRVKILDRNIIIQFFKECRQLSVDITGGIVLISDDTPVESCLLIEIIPQLLRIIGNRYISFRRKVLLFPLIVIFVFSRIGIRYNDIIFVY